MSKKFCTAISCIDGRIQLPVIKYLQARFNADYVDLITETGPNLFLSAQRESRSVESILAKLRISVSNHDSVGIAVVGHHDCAGNPAPKAEQLAHIRDSIAFLQQHCQELEIIGLWVDENRDTSEIQGGHSKVKS